MKRRILCELATPVVVATALCWSLPSLAHAQDIEPYIDRYAGENGAGYLSPLAQVLGANLNSGFARSAKIEEGFHFRIEFLAPMSSISDDQKTFQATTEGVFTPSQTVNAPTVLGSRNTLSVPGDEGAVYNFPAGFDLNRLGTVMPQVTIGSVAGTEVTVRWLGFNLEDFGDFSHTGFGVRHSVSQYFEDLPLDLAAGALFQSFTLGDIVSASAVAAAVHASKDTGAAQLYGALTYETATLDVDYVRGGAGGETVSLALDGHSGIRLTGGVEVGVSILSLRGDITVGPQTVFGLGLAFGK